MQVNLVQYCRAVRDFSNWKFTNKLQYKEISKLKFIQTCFIAGYHYLCSHSIHSVIFYAIHRLFSFKVLKGVKLFAFATFCATFMHLWRVKWLYSILLILLSDATCCTDETFPISH